MVPLMKRTGNLFEKIVDRANLRLAVSKSLRGKRDRPDARHFTGHLEANLQAMAAGLQAGTYPLGRYRQFVIHDPKRRIITAPCFAERVLHHAMMNVCEPVFERWLIDDTFACRAGRGRLAALERARRFAGRFDFFLKLDVRKYFDSVPHGELLARLARLFKDAKLLDLWGQIVHSFRPAVGRGLPIGALTSQHMANFYLGWFDRFVKEQLHIKGYVRYMDDMVLWGLSSNALTRVHKQCEEFLKEQLGLSLKGTPHINRSSRGMDFLGCRIYQRHMTLNRRSRQRFRHKLAAIESLYEGGHIDERELQSRATALTAFTETPGLSSWRCRRRVLEQLAVSGQKARTA